MAIWFEGSSEIECSIQQVKERFEDYGEHYVGVVSFMPGLTSVELVDQGSDSVTIQTNEGLMKRMNISRRIEDESVVMEFDEEYQASSMVNVKSHYFHEFKTSATGVTHRVVISDVDAPGFMGFFYRNFGKSNIGKAVLNSYKTYFEKQKA